MTETEDVEFDTEPGMEPKLPSEISSSEPSSTKDVLVFEPMVYFGLALLAIIVALLKTTGMTGY